MPAGYRTVTEPVMKVWMRQKYGYVPAVTNCVQNVVPGTIMLELNVLSGFGELPLVTVCDEGPLLVHCTISFTLMLIFCGVKLKSWIVTFVVPVAGQATTCAADTPVATKLTPVIFEPLIVCRLLAGLNVKPAIRGVTV